jgi:hypothetical protein
MSITMGVALVATVAQASGGAGNPVYLKCDFGSQALVNLSADEGASSVSISVPSTGYTARFRAIFSATEVAFEDSQLAYRLSRTDLSITREIKLINDVETGKCAIEAPPKRAF